MRIGIITMTEGFNYGCKLQNYALLKTISKLFPNDEVITLKNHTCCGNSFWTYARHYIKLLLTNRRLFLAKTKKQMAFNKFNKQYLNFSDYTFRTENIGTIDEFDCYVCGSDQIWNPHYVPSIYINTAYGAPGRVKRISYAASMGVTDLPQNRFEEYKKSIGSLDAISVREYELAELLKEITSRDVSVVLDPTLLLDQKEWEEFEKKPQSCPERYILTYFLTEQTNERMRTITEYAERQGIPIIKLNDINQKDWFYVSPNEFVYLISHCEELFTDSFHGTVFAVLFQKAFWCFSRNSIEKSEKQSSRVKTLLKMVGLETRYIDNERNFGQDIDFCGVEEKLAVQIESSLQFLKKAIELKDKRGS